MLENFLKNLKFRNSIFTASLITVTLMILVVYWSDILILVNEAIYDEALTHTLLVPAFFLYIVYTKRTSIKASIEFSKFQNLSKISILNELTGLVLCLLAVLVMWYGSNTLTPLEYHMLSVPLFISGAVIFLFNTKTLNALIFPILFLLFLVPIPSDVTYGVGGFLANFNTQTAYSFLKLIGMPVILDSTYGSPIIALTNVSDKPILFSIDLACSGVYSLIAFVMVSVFLAYIMHGSTIKKAAVFIIGMLFMQILNIIRIITIVLTGYAFGEETAMSLVHVTAGWLLIFVGMIIILIISEKVLHLKLFHDQPDQTQCPKCTENSKKENSFCVSCGKFIESVTKSFLVSKRFLTKNVLLLIFLLIITTIIQTPLFAFATGLTISDPGVNQNIDVFPEIEDYDLRFLYRDSEYEKISGQDYSLTYAYISLNGSVPSVYIDIGVSSTVSNLHNWEYCYVTYQTTQGKSPLVTVIDSKDVTISEKPNIVGRYFTFENPNNYTQVTLYWYQTAFWNSGISIERKFVRTSLIILTEIQESYDNYEEKLLEAAKSISNHWEPLITQNVFSLSVPFLQGLTIFSAIFVIATIAGQQLERSTRKNRNKSVYELYASKEDKILYDIITSINEGTGATITEISQALTENNGYEPDSEELFKKLIYLKNNSIIDIDLAIKNGSPYLLWKP